MRRREDSNWFSRYSYTFVSPLLQKGQKQTLTPEDFAPIETSDEAKRSSERLKQYWDEEVATRKNPRIWMAAFKTFGGLHLRGSLLFVVEMLLQIAQANFLALVLNFFQDKDAPPKQGYLYAMGLTICVFAAAMLHHVDFYFCVRAGMQTRVAFVALIYRKLLSLSLAHTSSGGIIVNMISNDVQRFDDAAPFLAYLIIGPIEVILSTYFMWLQISWGAFAAVGALLLLIPIQGWLGTRFGGLRKKSVHQRDTRIRGLSDLLTGIMIVKLYAWETPFKKEINRIRDDEMKYIRKANLIRATNEAFFFASSAVVALFGFITYYLIGGTFTPARIFSTLALLSNVRLSMTNFFPKAIQFSFEAKVSFDRIQAFLSLPDMESEKEKDMDLTLLNGDRNVLIKMKDASFSWESSLGKVIANSSSKKGEAEEKKKIADLPKLILNGINFELRSDELAFVVGPVGSGKTSLLTAILGEMTKKSGTYAVRPEKSIAYVSQSPWIINGTVKENILFGRTYDPEWFNTVIQVCAMEHDLDLFPDRENTSLGERGVNLSGGQRARLSLARAVYSRADIYLLDDPLSAVDTKVGRHIFEKCINGLLKDSARLLVTHQLQYIDASHTVLLFDHGFLLSSGSYNKVVSEVDSPFTRTMRDFVEKVDDTEKEEDQATEEEEKEEEKLIKSSSAELETELKMTEGNKEDSATGSVGFKTYYRFFTAGSNAFVFVSLMFLMVMGQASLVINDWWLARWTNQSDAQQDDTGLQNATIYAALCIAVFLISSGRAVYFFVVCNSSTKTIFRQMFHSVMRSPMSFFHKNPVGRLMNRFSKDMNIADEMLPLTMFDFMQTFFMVVGIFVVSIIVIPYVLVGLAPIFVLFYFLRRYFVASSRQIKRLESTTRSPVYSAVSSTLEGLPTIRAYNMKELFLNNFIHLQNENTRIYFAFISTSRWLGLRLDMLAGIFLTLIAFLAIVLRESVAKNTGLVGLILNYAMQLLGLMQWSFRQSAEVETLMVSAERVLEYTKLPEEAEEVTSVRPPAGWPQKGHITASNLNLQYPGSNAPVLKNISLDVPGGTKIGVVGRTGAGKSSLLQALFRLVEPSPSGCLTIDGINISEIGLADLRSSLSIIPQEPFLFKGTLRFNIDPFSKYTDTEIWKALEAVELKRSVAKQPQGLDALVSENGSNWSFGERQLRLARAILKNTNLILMDEATSSVDMRTDGLIQKAIRSELFKNATVLTIAHRLVTVIDFDCILVLDSGRIVEYGKPYEMLCKPADAEDAWFRRMVDEMGEEAKAALVQMAQRKHEAQQQRE